MGAIEIIEQRNSELLPAQSKKSEEQKTPELQGSRRGFLRRHLHHIHRAIKEAARWDRYNSGPDEDANF